MDLRRDAKNASWVQSLRKAIQRRGTVAGHRVWTAEEDKVLRDLYPDYAAAKRALNTRSLSAIRNEAQKLGIAPKRQLWTSAEVLRLRRLYPTASRQVLLEAFPGANWVRINHKAQHIGLRRPPFKFKPTPWPLLNAIRARAHQLGYTLVDLDAMAGTGKYFQRAGWNW